MHFSGAICTAPRKLSQISGNLEVAQSSRNPFCCHREVLKLCEAFLRTFSNSLLAARNEISENEMSTIFWSGDILQTPLQVTQCKASLINFLDLPKIVLDPFSPFQNRLKKCRLLTLLCLRNTEFKTAFRI